MVNYFRKLKEKEWKKEVDISHLFRIKQATTQLRKLSTQMQSKPMLKEVEEIEGALAVIDEQVVCVELKEHAMPKSSGKARRRARREL